MSEKASEIWFATGDGVSTAGRYTGRTDALTEAGASRRAS
jgi:hypothetical protein